MTKEEFKKKCESVTPEQIANLLSNHLEIVKGFVATFILLTVPVENIDIDDWECHLSDWITELN